MNYHILPEIGAVRYKPELNEKTVMVRIYSPDTDVVPLQYESLFSDIVVVYFEDISYKDFPNGHHTLKMFSDEEAKILYEFFYKHQDKDTFVFHCSAGICRSPSVAIGFANFMDNKDMIDKILNSDRFTPNQTVTDSLVSYIKKQRERK